MTLLKFESIFETRTTHLKKGITGRPSILTEMGTLE